MLSSRNKPHYSTAHGDLQVLDGAPIEAAEQAAAKSKYSGRLTLEFLEDRLGHSEFNRIRVLDISGLKVCTFPLLAMPCTVTQIADEE